MLYSIELEKCSLTLSVNDAGIDFADGALGDFRILPSPIFNMTLENLFGETFSASSTDGWRGTRHLIKDNLVKLWFSCHEKFGDVTVVVTGKPDENGFSWYVDVINESPEFSVVSVTYPIPKLAASPLHLFEP